MSPSWGWGVVYLVYLEGGPPGTNPDPLLKALLLSTSR